MAFDLYMLQDFWEKIGAFDILLPFLLIFGVVFGILNGTGVVSRDKKINVLLAIVIGALALRLPMVSEFFKEIFPRLGVAVSIILVILILLGLFMSGRNPTTKWILFSVAGVIALFVIFGSFSSVGWGAVEGWFDNEVVAWIISGALLIGIIVAVTMSKEGDATTPKTPEEKAP